MGFKYVRPAAQVIRAGYDVYKSLPKRRVKKTTFAAKVRKVVHKTESTITKLSTQTVALRSGLLYTFNPLGAIPTGTGDYSRSGEDIYAMMLKMKCLWVPTISDDNVFFKAYGIWSDLEVGGATDAFLSSTTTGLLINNVFKSTGIAEPTIMHIDVDKVSVTSRRSITSTPKYSGNQDTKQFELNFKLNKTIKFVPGSVFTNKKNFYVVVLAYTKSAVPGATEVGTFYSNTILTFKNGN